MIEYKNNSHDNVVEIAVEGKLTEADFERAISQMTADIEKHGKLRLLEEIRSFEGMDLMALWKDAQFGLKHVNDFSHVAVVADAEWMRTIAAAAGNVLSAEVKAFDRASIDAARNWLITASDEELESGLQYNRIEDTPVVEIVVEGKITAADIDNVIKEVEVDLAKYEKLRVLEDIRDFKGIDPMALWIDLKQISKVQKISHAAIVADAKWVKTVAEAISGLYPFEMKVYERSQITEAREWLATAH
ncbi:MAG: STAS/SEC14 domain-containing protein [Phormidesmis sp. RL_2_1]|nr:STAS/SEC14 domain-containing protein [Phormidesmis sp. RL_2_1]